MLPILLTAFANSAFAAMPVEEWNRTYGGPYGDGAWSVHDTDDGGYIFAGYTSSLGQASDLWLVKTDSQGYMQWNKTFVGSGEDVGYFATQTADGGYIVTGCTKSYGMGEERLWLIKTDSNGSREWDHIFGGFVSSSGDGGWAVDQTGDNGFIVTGYTRSYGAGGMDLWLIKTDSAGNRQWDKTFGGPKDDVGMSVVPTQDGGYIAAGRTASLSSGDDDIWLLKVNPEGGEQWNRTFGGQRDDVALQVIVLKDGYALTGRTESVDSGGKKAFLLKTDLYGKKLWERSYGQDGSGISLQQTYDGGFIIAGSMNMQATGKDAMLIKTDLDGNEQWIMPLCWPGNDMGTSVANSRSGGYVMAGITNSFGAGAEEAWFVKVGQKNALSAYGNAVRNLTFHKSRQTSR
jgi:hypothetical protein